MRTGVKGFPPKVSVQPPSPEIQLLRSMKGKRVAEVVEANGEVRIFMEDTTCITVKVEDEKEDVP